MKIFSKVIISILIISIFTLNISARALEYDNNKLKQNNEKIDNSIVQDNSSNSIQVTENKQIETEQINVNTELNESRSNELLEEDLQNNQNSSDICNELENNNLDQSDANIENIVENSNKVELNPTEYENNYKNNSTISDNEEKTQTPSIKYSTHIQNVGWQSYMKDEEMSGTEGKSLRIEAIRINIEGLEKSCTVKYQTHIQNIGWQSWKKNGEISGTEGKSLRIEAIKIRLESTEEYSVMYRVHIQNIGWQEWKSDGDVAGTEGQSLRIEAIQIKIVDKISKGKILIESPTNNTRYYEREQVRVSGWKMSNLADTYIKAYMDDVEIESTISYSKRSDVISNISGYGTSVENSEPGFSFLVTTKNLESGAHTITIKLFDSSENVLSDQSVIIIVDDEIQVKYCTHVQNIGWQNYVLDGNISGTEGMAYRIEAMKISLINLTENQSIKYRVHVQNVGWQDWKSDGSLAGTEGESLRIEAVQIRLENMDEYTVEYQVHIQDIGWSDWYIDGETAGTVGKSKRIEAIRIRLVPKYKRKNIGVDVSQYNGTIDWKSVKNSGIDFAMIRVGFRGWGQAGNFKEDSNFKANFEAAKAAGLKVGVYFVTQAITEQESIEEANWVLNKIRNYKLDYPVALDIEKSTEPNGNGRADHLDKNTRTILAKRFCEVIQNAGYIPIIYLNVNWAKNYLDMSRLSEYDVWIANYKHDMNLVPSYTGPYTIWQYTDVGIINGIPGYTDVNVCYKKY